MDLIMAFSPMQAQKCLVPLPEARFGKCMDQRVKISAWTPDTKQMQILPPTERDRVQSSRSGIKGETQATVSQSVIPRLQVLRT